MKSNFDAVAFQQKVRKELSQEYLSNPKKFRARLKKINQSKASPKS